MLHAQAGADDLELAALLAERIVEQLAEHDVPSDIVRVVDEQVSFGVSIDEGDRTVGRGSARACSTNIVVHRDAHLMGQPASVAKTVLERLDAKLSQTDDQGRLLTFGKVAQIGCGRQRGRRPPRHRRGAQALDDTGFTLAANAGTYW